MAVTYERAPLVELIVELRWAVAAMGPPDGPQVPVGASTTFDRWFEALASRLRGQEYRYLERLVPHEMPPMVGQPIFRFRREDERFPGVQLGHGIFTVNAGPPSYQSWEAFQPVLRAALEAFVETRPADGPNELASASLRYIDRFDEELRAGAPCFRFIVEDLGIEIPMPDHLKQVCADPATVLPNVGLRFPVRDARATLTVQIAAGRFGPAGPWDTAVAATYTAEGPIPFEPDAVLGTLGSGYNILHAWFESLIRKIRDRLKPVEHG